MNAQQRKHFRKILEALKAELSQEIDRTVHTMQDEATVFADPNDRASQESDMALELRNRDRERKLIKKIDETIAQHRRQRVRLLRQLRRRDRPEAPGGAPDRDAVHRLQDARRAARAPGREVSNRSQLLFAVSWALIGLHGKAHAALVVGLEHLDLHDLAFLQVIRDRVDALVADLRDVQQAVAARQQLHDRAEVEQAQHRALVDLADFDVGGDVLDALARRLAAFGRRRRRWRSCRRPRSRWWCRSPPGCARMTTPPLPMTSRILSGLILILMMRGAKVDSSVREPSMPPAS